MVAFSSMTRMIFTEWCGIPSTPFVQLGTDSSLHRQSFDNLPFAQDYALADPSTNPGYLCTDVRFQSPAQLYRIIEVRSRLHTFSAPPNLTWRTISQILKEQLIINSLVTSVLAPSNRVASFTAYANKRRKLTTDQAVPSLESLLARALFPFLSPLRPKAHTEPTSHAQPPPPPPSQSSFTSPPPRLR